VLQQKVTNPLHIRCTRVSPYTFRSTDIGVVHDLMIHDIDLVLALTGDTVETVESFGAVTFGPHEDMAVARLRTRGGVIADLTTSRMNPTAERSIQVWSADGYFTADLQTRRVSSWQAAGQFRNNPALVHAIAASTADPRTLKDQVFSEWMQHEEIQASDTDALTAELREFVDCVRNKTTPTVSSRQAVQAMSVAEQVVAGLKLWNYQTGQSSSTRSRAA
ncbi:MAG: gfo/Idh/MocA family oxidoreductase, partial [Planctomycetaceae bacterium]|nr:gfo/Idh/MocA family oxidoreductase [Planctomycetaceae bacterium]